MRAGSAYGSSLAVNACVKAKVEFSVVLTKNRAVTRAIGTIADDAWTPVDYPGAVVDPDTGALISDAEVAETTFTAFASTSTTSSMKRPKIHGPIRFSPGRSASTRTESGARSSP